jgi:hypothetical protein
MVLEDISLEAYEGYPRGREFYPLIACIEDLYYRTLGKITTRGVGKLVISLAKPGTKLPPVEQIEDIMTVFLSFDFDALWRADDDAKKRMIVEAIHEGLVKAAKKKGWSLKPFNDAHEKVLEDNIVNERFVKKIAVSKNKRRAQLFIACGLKSIELYAVVFDSTGQEIKRFLVKRVKAKGGEGVLGDAIGTLNWMSDSKLRLTAESKKWNKTFAIPEPRDR